MKKINHFIDINKIQKNDILNIINRAQHLKKEKKENGTNKHSLQGKSLAMIFEKNSTRTRVSFEIGMKELGGITTVLNSQNLQLSRGESPKDTIKVLSNYVNIVMIRAMKSSTIDQFVEYSKVPIINGLTDISHPCQIIADMLCLEENLGSIDGKIVLWSGDRNNVLNSWIHLSQHFDFELRIACPSGLNANNANIEIIKNAKKLGASIIEGEDIFKLADNADCIITDCWVSMGLENFSTSKDVFKNYQINSDIMKKAKENAIFMHCLPAYRGQEVTSEVIDGKQSVVWQEAENRLHVQKAIIEWCLGVI